MKDKGERIWAYLELFFGILLWIGFIWRQIEIGKFGGINGLILSSAIGGAGTILILNFVSYKRIAREVKAKCQIKKEQDCNA